MINIKNIVNKMPEKPGIYIYRDETGKVIYVGKAKKLKRRVSSYFVNSKNHSVKTLKLVENIRDIEYIVVDSEEEALILECNFIKRYRPKYNILLKDDKTYPYIKVTNEKFPRLFVTRHIDKDGGKYFGPFPDVLFANEITEFLVNYFKLRKCVNLKEQKRPCLNYDMGLCSSPCTGKIDSDEYKKNVEAIIRYFEGHENELIRKLKLEMQKESDNCNFEKAAYLRDAINLARCLNEKQKITSNDFKHADIVALAKDEKEEKVLVQILSIRDGKMLDRKYMLFDNAIDESDEEILTSFMNQYYGEACNIPREIMTPFDFEQREDVQNLLSKIAKRKVEIIVPKVGKNKKLIELAEQNAKISIETLRNKSYYKEDVRKEFLEELRTLLDLDSDISRIESYDISNISGVDNVASMVVFTDGEKTPSEYRKFKIKTVDGANDVACMKEVLERRFTNYLQGEKNFSKKPDLIMMDGGRNQVNAALEVINKLNLDINVCGLVKDDHHRTNKILFNDKEIKIDTSSELFKFITRVQDEVHRVAIGYFKKLHGKNALKSILDEIPGVGEKRKIALYNKFKTVDAMKKASIEDLTSLDEINEKVAINIKEYFKKLEGLDE
ncbi:MAG: excinuclease ABC subunit UvrC [Clostridia bacterium]|nr:excinuclease ABC subunit UvrC [Clostridia bacterium]